MNIHDEIDTFADEEYKKALKYLFSKYHNESQWNFVAKCTHEKHGPYSYQTNRIWSPTKEGWILYGYSLLER